MYVYVYMCLFDSIIICFSYFLYIRIYIYIHFFIFKRDGELIRNPYRWLAKTQDKKDKKRKDRKSNQQVRSEFFQKLNKKKMSFPFVYH